VTLLDGPLMDKAMVAACILASLSMQADAAEPHFAGSCFSVHGRLEQANGVPSLRIWRIGTKRILGVFDCAGRDESPDAIPHSVKALVGPYVSGPVYGDFLVCPFTSERAGWMQMVCIAKASHLVALKSN
jgi:hypothetical protein